MEEKQTIGEILLHMMFKYVVAYLKGVSINNVYAIKAYNNESLWLYVFAYNHHNNLHGLAILPFVSKNRTVNYKICGLVSVDVVNKNSMESWSRTGEKIIRREMPKDAARIVCIYFGMLFVYFKWPYIIAPHTMHKNMRILQRKKFLDELPRELERRTRGNVQEMPTYNITSSGIYIKITVMSVVHKYHITHKIVGSHYCSVMCYIDAESIDSNIVMLSWDTDILIMTVAALLCLSAIDKRKWSYVATRTCDILHM